MFLDTAPFPELCNNGILSSMDICKVCNGTFKRHYLRGGVRQIYCSRACRYADSYVDKTCLTCGKTFRSNTFSRNKGYCSLECIERRSCHMCGKPVTGRNKMNGVLRRVCGRRGSSVLHRSLTPKASYRLLGFAYTIARRGRLACEECHLDEVEVLHVHHLRGRKRGNAPDNLITLCANCHDRRHRAGSRDRKSDAERA